MDKTDVEAAEQPAAPHNARQKLMQSIMDLGNKAFNPDASESSRAQGQLEFNEFVERTKTINIIGAFNILIRPGHVPPWLRTKLMEILTLVPLRPDGVRATLEFVFSVHPSSTIKVSEAAVPQKKGANITHEALEMASRLISTPPAAATPETWYAGVSPQLLELLDGNEGPELTKVVAYIIGFGVLGRKASGAPGTAGWKYLAEPILRAVRPPLRSTAGLLHQTNEGDVINLSRDRVLVSPRELATMLSRLHSLVVSHPNPGLCKRLLLPLLLPLWTLSSWDTSKPAASEKPRASASELLKIQLKLVSSSEVLLALIHNVGYLGGYDRQNPEWVYAETDEGEIRIIQRRRSPGADIPISLEQIDRKIRKLLEIVDESFSDADISTAFIDLLGRWLKSARKSNARSILIKEESADEKDPLTQLTEIKLLQAMMEKFPEKLAHQPKHILELVGQILTNTQDMPETDDEVIGVALSLLNMIVTAPGFQKSRVNPDVLSAIESSLDKLSKDNSEASATARNLSLLLQYRDHLDDPTETLSSAPTDRQIEDRKTYSLAVTYLTQPDSPPPVKFEGLNLISNLITASSPILDIPGILVLLSSIIADSEDYLNLKAIAIYTLLAHKHPKAVTKELLDHYVDAKETSTVDTRLRFGEALLRVIERLGETFTGEAAQQVGDALLFVASRRGNRPKTEARQAREEKKRQMERKEAEEAWDGEVPDLDEDIPEEEKLRNEILSKIVEGWESKRGAEDVRIRASALSVLGNAMETNIAGLGPGVVSKAVDLAVSVVQLEKEEEKGILRRAAVLLVMSFLKALDEAKKTGRRLGFGFGAEAREDVVRALGYVRETDGDGLVREYAGDVLESLENWEMGRLVVDGVEGQREMGGLMKLKGLEVDLERAARVKGNGEGRRPRIEEIE